MTAPTAVVRDEALAVAGTRRRLADFLALAKPRVVLMVVLTTLVGYYLGASSDLDVLRLVHLLVGTALAAGGTLALNQFLERDVDAQMLRTRTRPLPDGRLQPVEAAAFGTLATVGESWAWGRLSSSPSCSSGSFRTRSPSPGCTATTTRAPVSASCRWSTRTAAAPSGRS